MKSTFESLMEDMIPEINFLSASGDKIVPGSVLESLDKDVVVGYLPEYLKKYIPMRDKSFETISGNYDITTEEIEGTVSYNAALSFMKFVGLDYDTSKNYKLDFEIADIAAVGYKENLFKIEFEMALRKLRKEDRKTFKRFKGHFLVFQVLYASSYKVNVEVEREGKFEADVDVKYVKVGGDASFEKKESSLIVSHNEKVPFGVIGFKIKSNQLKEVD